MLEIFQGPSVEGTDVIEDWLPVEDLRSLFVPLIGHFNRGLMKPRYEIFGF